MEHTCAAQQGSSSVWFIKCLRKCHAPCACSCSLIVLKKCWLVSKSNYLRTVVLFCTQGIRACASVVMCLGAWVPRYAAVGGSCTVRCGTTLLLGGTCSACLERGVQSSIVRYTQLTRVTSQNLVTLTVSSVRGAQSRMSKCLWCIQMTWPLCMAYHHPARVTLPAVGAHAV